VVRAVARGMKNGPSEAGRAVPGPVDAALGRDGLELATDDAELAADLAAHEDQRDDRDDCDKGENECVFGETLAPLVIAEERTQAVQRGPDVHEITSFLRTADRVRVRRLDAPAAFGFRHGRSSTLPVNSPNGRDWCVASMALP